MRVFILIPEFLNNTVGKIQLNLKIYNMRKLSLLIFILAAVNGISFARHYENAIDTFPPGFGKGKTYLYVITVPGYFQVNNALKKVMEKNYTGEYEVIDSRDFFATKPRKGVNNFVLAMIYDNQDGYFRTGERVGPVTNYSCGVKDLATGTLYSLPYVGGNYKKVMEKYIKRLEEIRISNAASK